MSRSLRAWTESVWEKLGQLPEVAGAVEEQRRRWLDFAANDAVVVVLVGPYDAGKSTLLKRLLVERGTPVPEWLTISGRRETFGVGQVRSDEIIFVDTPGLDSSQPQHDEITWNALRLADAYVWVLPPQLLTAGKDDAIAFFKGAFFHDELPSAFVAGATVAVIGRMDEADSDPAYNLKGYRDLAHRKKLELASLLKKGGVSGELRKVCVVAADPYQIVENNPSPTREDYDTGRDWDGIGELAVVIQNLAAEKDELRTMAEARFVAALVREATEALGQMQQVSSLMAQRLANDVDKQRHYLVRLNTLQRATLADLHRRFENELRSVIRVGAEWSEDTAHRMEASMNKVIEEWAESAQADYERLVSEIDAEIAERLVQPSTDALYQLMKKIEESESEIVEKTSQRPGLAVPAGAFGKAVLRAFDEYVAMKLGRPVTSFADRFKWLFTMVKAPERISRGAVKLGKFLDAAGPALTELGELLGEAVEARRAREREQRRAELRLQLREELSRIESEVAASYVENCERLENWLQKRLDELEKTRHEEERRVHLLTEFIGLLRAVLQEVPSL